MISRPRAGHGPVKHGNAHYWAVIRGFGRDFTYRDVHATTDGATIDTVRIAVTGLVRAGLVELVREEPRGVAWPRKVFRCVRPDIRIPPGKPGPRRGQGLRQLQMWRAMRTLSSWTILELARAASTDVVEVSPELAGHYVCRLVKAGVVQVLQPKRRRLNGSHPGTYRLRPAANTGPRAPEIYRGQGVFDPNRRTWAAGAEAAA